MTNRQLPEKWGKIADEVMDRDRAYFEAHPETSVYVRAYIYGEFFPHIHPEDTLVRVTKIGGNIGMRTREVVGSPPAFIHPEGEDIAPQEGEVKTISREQLRYIKSGEWVKQVSGKKRPKRRKRK